MYVLGSRSSVRRRRTTATASAASQPDNSPASPDRRPANPVSTGTETDNPGQEPVSAGQEPVPAGQEPVSAGQNPVAPSHTDTAGQDVDGGLPGHSQARHGQGSPLPSTSTAQAGMLGALRLVIKSIWVLKLFIEENCMDFFQHV